MVEPWLLDAAQRELLSTLIFQTLLVCFFWAYKEQITLEMELLSPLIGNAWFGMMVIFTAMDLATLALRHATGARRLPSIIRVIFYYLGITTR